MCFSTSSEEASASRTDREIERELKQAKIRQGSQINVLLLGAGDSGKSTVLKQMRLIHRVRFSAEEVESFRLLVFKNIIDGMRLILEALPELDLHPSECNTVSVKASMSVVFTGRKILINLEDYPPLIESAPDLRDGEPFPRMYLTPLQCLWNDRSIQAAVLRGNEVALPDNLKYFFSHLDRLFAPSYRPTEQDILHSRARTTSITQTVFQLKTYELRLYDVGGQRSERRKWIHCFEDVNSILFLASLNGYDVGLSEDAGANQMQDAMAIWDSVCHSQWFKTTSIILFLNKVDLFEQKIEHSPINSIFGDFEGRENDATEGKEYFKKRFLRLAQKSSRSRMRDVYVHFTNATDTALLRVVMSAVEEYVVFHLCPFLPTLPDGVHTRFRRFLKPLL